jgi:hypothetical protein
MNSSTHNENDILGKYINPERIEKAPEGMAEKIMTRIQLERAPLIITGRFRLNVVVPVMSAIITLTLVLFAVLFSSPSDNTVISGIIKSIRNLNFTIPEIKMDTFSGFSLPATVIYIVIGFFILTLFDRALNIMFNRRRK